MFEPFYSKKAYLILQKRAVSGFIDILIIGIIGQLNLLLFENFIHGIILTYTVLINKDFFQGKSIGKRIMGLQVFDGNNTFIASPFKCALRNFLILIPFEQMAIIISPQKRLGDILAKTYIDEEIENELVLSPKFISYQILLAGIWTVINFEIAFFIGFEIIERIDAVKHW